MKLSYNTLKFILFLAFAFSMFTCTKEEVDPPVDPPVVIVKPKIDSMSLSIDSKLLTIYFSQGVYGYSKDEQLPVGNSHLDFELTGGEAILDSIDITHIAGDSVALVELYISGVIDGNEVLKVRSVNDSSVMNQQHHYMDIAVKSIYLNETGIFGFWISTDTNLSPLFQQFNFDSVVMEYKADGTYTFETIKTGSIHNYLSGTYVQSNSTVEGIWLITLNQQLPVVSTMEGIFSLQNTTPIVLKYETVQTMPEVQGLTAPTPQEGFGSSGLFGEENIQTFIKVALN